MSLALLLQQAATLAHAGHLEASRIEELHRQVGALETRLALKQEHLGAHERSRDAVTLDGSPLTCHGQSQVLHHGAHPSGLLHGPPKPAACLHT